jgi:dGTPase
MKRRAKQSDAAPYCKLLTAWRVKPTSRPGRTLSVEAESDRGRVLFSEAFRRLHQKAQVFSLEGDSSVRTRLTHSLEVAQIW